MKGVAAQSCSVGGHYQCSTQLNQRNQRTAGACGRLHVSQGRHCHCASTPAPLLHLMLHLLLLLLLLLLEPAGSLVGRHQQPALELVQRRGCASGLCVRRLLPLWQRRVSASAAGVPVLGQALATRARGCLSRAPPPNLGGLGAQRHVNRVQACAVALRPGKVPCTALRGRYVVRCGKAVLRSWRTYECGQNRPSEGQRWPPT